MVISMQNNLIQAVKNRLDTLFNEKEDKVDIYVDEVKQGLQGPCFFVQILELTRKQMIGRHYYNENQIGIQYLPDPMLEDKTKLYQVGETLFNNMEWIQLEDGLELHGTKMKQTIKEGVLSFYVQYNFFVWKEEEKAEYMTELQINNEKKE